MNLDFVLKVLRSTSLQTYFEVFEVSLKAIIGTEFNFAMYVRLIYGAPVVLAYVSTRKYEYILIILVLDLKGTRLLLLMIRYRVLRAAVGLQKMLWICVPNFRRQPVVTPMYSTKVKYFILVLFRKMSSTRFMLEQMKNTSTVFSPVDFKTLLGKPIGR